jgi:hypothetical protein
MSKKILICSDSFGVTDPAYPGLHWSEQILNFSPEYEVMNLSTGGCSNTLITLQLLQGLRFDPDFVIFSFTSSGRYEYDNKESAMPQELTPSEISNYIKQRYTTNSFQHNSEKNKLTNKWITACASENIEKLKNYFSISFCLATVASEKIPFCFSLGGFEHNQDYVSFLKNNYVKNLIIKHSKHEILTNLWNHAVTDNNAPNFHVPDPTVQRLFASECIAHMEKTYNE